MMRRAILIDKKPVLTDDLLEWAKYFEKGSRQVAETESNEVRVSTVFLGLDHSFGGSCSLWFETMVFGGQYDQYMDRYETWEQAEQGHEDACRMVWGEQ